VISLAKGTLIAFIGIALYLTFGRRRVLNWGASRDEATRTMPGDDLLRNASLQTTRAVTIEAPPDAIWPWLAQMGPRPRAGAYTYDWIERLLGIDIANSDRILPEFQQLEAGQNIGLNKKGEGLAVRQVEVERSLVLQWVPGPATWTFALYPDDIDITRLISRNRIPGKGPLFWLGMIGFMEWGSLIMERKMLLGIKTRAERLASEKNIAPLQVQSTG
jgi:hypothetical protein